MTATSKYSLGDLIQIKHGYAFKGKFFSDKGSHVVLTPGNFFEEGGFKSKDQEKWYTGNIPEEYVLEKGSLLVAMTEQAEGLLGSSAIVPEDSLFLHNQRLGLVQIIDEAKLDKRYLYYLFNTYNVRGQIKSTASGTKVRHTSPSRIYEVEVNIPKLEVQQKVASILSAFDDLIENNTRRIEILEEMARRIYREWFVHFRYPGHEKDKMVDSNTELGEIPEGWEVQKLEDLCDLILGQSPKSEFYNEIGEGLPFHQGVKDFGDHYPTTTTWCTKIKRVAEEGDILFSVRAPVGRINIANTKMVIGRGLHAIRSKFDSQVFIFHQLKDKFQEEDTMGGGTIFKSVTKKDMLNLKLLDPGKVLVEKFEKQATPIFKQIKALTEKNEKLKETRNLLLPKLISGKVMVE